MTGQAKIVKGAIVRAAHSPNGCVTDSLAEAKEAFRQIETTMRG